MVSQSQSCVQSILHVVQAMIRYGVNEAEVCETLSVVCAKLMSVNPNMWSWVNYHVLLIQILSLHPRRTEIIARSVCRFARERGLELRPDDVMSKQQELLEESEQQSGLVINLQADVLNQVIKRIVEWVYDM